MNKATIITFLLAMSAAVALTYAVGVFDKPQPSVYVPIVTKETTPIETVTPTTAGVAPADVSTPTQQEVVPTASQPQTTTPSTSTGITASEVAKHATRSDCWMIISGNVYDFSSYIMQHPGGQTVIARECGSDGTATFMEVRKHARPSVQAELATYLLGKLQR